MTYPNNVIPFPPQQPQQPGQQQMQQLATDTAIVAAIAALLAAVPSPNPAALVNLLTRSARLTTYGQGRISRPAAEAIARLVTTWADPNTLPLGAASKTTQKLNLLRRGQYVLAAARRLTKAIGHNPTPQAVADAVKTELGYWRQHVAAGQNRTQGAALTDSVAVQSGGTDPATGKPGVVVGWRAVMDKRTSAECRAAHGKNFLVTKIPAIGLPGTVHPHCRCEPVAPWPTRKLVDGGLLPAAPKAKATVFAASNAVALSRRR